MSSNIVQPIGENLETETERQTETEVILLQPVLALGRDSTL